MKNLKYFVTTTFCLLILFSCSKEDDITPLDTKVLLNESVSGSVFIDGDLDGIGDEPYAYARVYLGEFELVKDILGEKPDTLPAPYNEILWADVDLNGGYIMNAVLPNGLQNLVLYSPISASQIKGTDNTPDGDFLEEEIADIIFIEVETDEQDDGNDFIVQIAPITINGSVSGMVELDFDKDGIIDGPLPNAHLWINRANANGDPLGGSAAFDDAYTDDNGNYTFNDVSAGEYVIILDLFSDSTGDILATSSGDASPDTDIPAATFNHLIPVALIEGENDTDNNFEVVHRWHTVSGYILEDTDGNTTGDSPLKAHRVEIYERNPNGNPIGALVAWTQSDVNGYYRFYNLDPAEYVIFYIGVGGYDCVSGMDQTPEAGEPTNNVECFFIQTDILTIDSEDADNVFIVKEI